jgi:oligoribonuclease NrnB/cAMP/cGMP phosphodiesterase (DHH superfamily)
MEDAILKVKLFTHTDLDGVGCAILGKLAFGDNIDIEYVDYNNVDVIVANFFNSKEFDTYNTIYITDISVGKETAEIIDSKDFTNIRLLDHHKTALWLNDYIWALVVEEDSRLSEKTSGTAIFYDELLYFSKIKSSDSINAFVDTVRKYDTWLWKEKYNDDAPKLWNDLFYILGRDRFVEKLTTQVKHNKFEFDSVDKLLLELEQEKIREYVNVKNKNIIEREVSGCKAGIVFGEQYQSELGNRLAELNPDLDFIMIVSTDKSISYRTIKEDIDLGQVAKRYGGGGHPKAAGSPITEEDKEYFIQWLLRKRGD